MTIHAALSMGIPTLAALPSGPVPYVNPKAIPYSVIADGTDESAKLQRAVDAVGQSGGGDILVPPGRIVGSVRVSYPDVRIWMMAGATLKAPSALAHVFTLAQAAHRFALFGGRLEGVATDSTTGQYGVFTEGQAAPNDVTIARVTFSGPDAAHGLNNAVLCDGLGVNGLGLRWRLLYNTVERLWGNIPGTGYGFLLSRAWFVVAMGNILTGAAGRGRHAFYTGNMRHSVIAQNEIDAFDDANIILGDYFATDALPGCERNLVALNVIKNGGRDAPGVGGIGLYGLARYNRIANNLIDGFKGRASIEISCAATGQQPQRNSIDDNEISNGDQFGINVQGAADTLVRKNTIRDISQLSSGTYGAIKVQQDNATTAANRTRIIGNGCYGVTNRCGVSLDAAAPVPTNTLVRDNDIPDFQTYPVEANGVGYVGYGNVGSADPMSGDRGDTNVSLTVGLSELVQRFASALTANRTVTLTATNAAKGARFRVVRSGLGAFTLDVGGLKTIPAGTAAIVDVEYNGSAWVLTGYSPL